MGAARTPDESHTAGAVRTAGTSGASRTVGATRIVGGPRAAGVASASYAAGAAHVTSKADATRAPHAASSSRYVPAIDGLRAFAVLAVIFYHMKLGWAPGGLMGVTVFFVISGYLINGLLVAERERTGRISLSQFWLRRVRRIIPAVLLAIAGTVALCALVNPMLLEKARPDIVPSLLFYNNWWQIFRDLSYFEAAGAPSPLTHYWSLAIEEQFYLVWPILLVVLSRHKLRKGPIAALVLALAVASAVEMALLYDPQGDPSRIYYGTDTRAMSLLAGAFLALVWPSAAFGERTGRGMQDERGAQAGTGSTRELGRASRFFVNVIGIGALAGLIAIIGFTTGYSAFPYQGGIALTSVLSALLIMALVAPETWVARLMSLSPLVWIGKRSYGMYLWHFPIILATSNVGAPIEVPWWVRVAQLVIVFVVSDLSFRFVEDPIRRGAIGKWWRRRHGTTENSAMKTGTVGDVEPAPRRGRLRVALTSIVVAGVFAGAVAGLALVDAPTQNFAGGNAESAPSEAVSSVDTRAESEAAAEKAREEAEAAKKREAERKEEAKSTFAELFETEHLNKAGDRIFEPLLIGDSVSAGAEDRFYESFPYGHIDALVNRNIWESPYADYVKSDQVGEYVVFCLGTNNAVVDFQIDDLMREVDKDTKVIFVNTQCPEEWCQSTNEAIARSQERYPNVVAIVDWYSASMGHWEYFWDDATHLRPEGADAYIELIKSTIEETLAS